MAREKDKKNLSCGLGRVRRRLFHVVMIVFFFAIIMLFYSCIAKDGCSDAQKNTGNSATKIEITVESNGIEMVKISYGEYEMGSDENEWGHEVDEEKHLVTISGSFLMSLKEITQDQWKDVFENNPSNNKSCGGDCPVEMTNWWEAITFVNKLSEQSNIETCYELKGCKGTLGIDYACKSVELRSLSCRGYRLPTEAEWEYAARAGSKGIFSTGECLNDEQANYDARYNRMGCKKGIYRKRTIEAGKLAKNRWSIYDMYGNVWEWVWDWKSDYSTQPVVDPVGPKKGKTKVVRGCGWGSISKYCRSANRGEMSPGARSSSLGFRIVKSMH